MKTTRWSRIVAIIAVGVSLGLALSGCVATAGNIIVHAAVNAKKATAIAGKPRVGECWQGSFKNVDGYANWGDLGAPVPCTSTHQLYTFGVPQLENIHKGKLFDKDDYAYEPIAVDASNTCYDTENIQLSTLDETDARLVVEAYLPEENAWNAGARWVRCDIGVLEVGSLVAHPLFEKLPDIKTLSNAISDAPEQFDFCVNESGGLGDGGPKGSNAAYADCRDNPQWVLEGYQDIISPVGDPYPSAAEMKSQYELDCESGHTDATHITYAYYPSKDDWKNGDEQLECWVGRK